MDSQTIRRRQILFIVSNFRHFMGDDYKPLRHRGKDWLPRYKRNKTAE